MSFDALKRSMLVWTVSFATVVALVATYAWATKALWPRVFGADISWPSIMLALSCALLGLSWLGHEQLGLGAWTSSRRIRRAALCATLSLPMFLLIDRLAVGAHGFEDWHVLALCYLFDWILPLVVVND